jgi:microcystin-dependent protein
LIPGGVPEKPTLEEFNHWMNNVYLWLNELNQVGVLSWDAVTTYAIGAHVVGTDFRIYRSLTAGNQNNDPVGDPVNWTDVLNDASELTGGVRMWMTSSIPSGFLECDGAAVSRTTYADLFAVLGTTYGIGDGATTFNLPDLRGEFIRGFDNGAGNDPDAAGRTDRGDGTTGDNVGTKQGHAVEDHIHSSSVNMQTFPGAGGTINEDAGTTVLNQNLSAVINGTSGATVSANETRGRNVGVMFIVKY